MIARALVGGIALALSACSAGGEPDPGEGPAAAEPASQPEAAVADLTTAELATRIADGSVTLIDVRTPEEFAEGHIEGAVLMPIDGFDPAKVPLAEGTQPVFYCRSGRRSLAAAEAWAEHSGEVAEHLEGGILAWEKAGKPTVN